MTTMTNWKPSDAQVDYATDLFKRKFNDTPQARQFWQNLRNATSNASLSTFINVMKGMPDKAAAQARPTGPVLPKLNIATEEGLYRDPSDGTLYRLSISKPARSWETPVKRISVYSNKAVYRRLTTEGRMVKKGKWTALKAYDRDALLHYTWRERKGHDPVGTKLLAEWRLSDEEKTEWAVGICLMCYKSLVDAVSVYNSIGPVCAKNGGIALQMPPEV